MSRQKIIDAKYIRGIGSTGGGGGGSGVQTVTGTAVDNTDPQNPVINKESLSGVNWGDIGGTLADQADLDGVLSSKLEDAPSDGKLYGRKDAAWSEVTGGGGGGNVGYACLTVPSANFNLAGAANATTKQTDFSTVLYDTAGLWDATNKKFVITKAGIYSITWLLRTVTNGLYNMYIRVNGSKDYVGSGNVNAVDHNIVADIYLAAGDYVEAFAWKNSTMTAYGSSSSYAQIFSITGPLSSSGGSGSLAFNVLASWDYTTDGTLTTPLVADLTGITEYQVLFDNVSSTTTSYRGVQTSTDGGTTWKTSGYSFTQGAGILGTSGLVCRASHGTASASGITSYEQAILNGTFLSIIRNAQELTYASSNGTAFIQKEAVNKIRAFSFTSAGAMSNLTGGAVTILGR